MSNKNNSPSDKALFISCEARARLLQIQRHLPVLSKYAKATEYGKQKILSVEEGRKVLVAAINEGKPFMAARFGTNEGAALYAYLKCRRSGTLDRYPKKNLEEMTLTTGFFPKSEEHLFKWAEKELEACKDLDILGIMNFMGEEWITRKYCSQAVLMPNGGLGSASKGWAWALEGKRVLVIHPFTDTIKSQYFNNREKIFPGTNALPKFDLQTVKAVQTIADETDERFSTWFEALDYMADEASKLDFDVALIGCGAYGFQLASKVKQLGKIAVHMGGSLQTMFGIRGSRWDVKYSSMYNDAWVYPSKEETPRGFEKVENGCYWNNK